MGKGHLQSPSQAGALMEKEEKIFLPAKQADVKQGLNHILFYNGAIYAFIDDFAKLYSYFFVSN